MEKILFYTNEWNDIEEIVQSVPDLEKAGIEVAFATDNRELVRLLSIGKMLVVTINSYYPDITVYGANYLDTFKGTVMSLKEFKETIK